MKAQMQDITQAMASFREAARHLWNSTFHPHADWDDRDRFSRVCVELFDAIVGVPCRIGGARLPAMCEPGPEEMRALRVIPAAASGVPIMINRDASGSGYWDDPVRQVCPSEVRMEFVNFFDFGELGRRDFKFVLVHLRDFPAHPHLVGRRALLEFEHVTFEVVDVAPS